MLMLLVAHDLVHATRPLGRSPLSRLADFLKLDFHYMKA